MVATHTFGSAAHLTNTRSLQMWHLWVFVYTDTGVCKMRDLFAAKFPHTLNSAYFLLPRLFHYRLPSQWYPCGGGHVSSCQHRSDLELHFCRLWSQCEGCLWLLFPCLWCLTNNLQLFMSSCIRLPKQDFRSRNKFSTNSISFPSANALKYNHSVRCLRTHTHQQVQENCCLKCKKGISCLFLSFTVLNHIRGLQNSPVQANKHA